MSPKPRHNARMAPAHRAVDERLSAVFGWFEAAPLPERLSELVDTLEAAQPSALPETRAFSPS